MSIKWTLTRLRNSAQGIVTETVHKVSQEWWRRGCRGGSRGKWVQGCQSRVKGSRGEWSNCAELRGFRVGSKDRVL